MNRTYQEPNAELIRFETADVIRTSDIEGDNHEGEGV